MRPVTEYELMLAAVVVTSWKFVPSGDLKILKPVSLVELSAQVRFIWVEETALAAKFEAAAGIPRGVVAVAIFEKSESPV